MEDAVKQLHALDRRLLAVERVLQARGGGSGLLADSEVWTASDDDLARLTVELRGIAEEAASLASRLGAATFAGADPDFTRIDSVGANAAIRRYIDRLQTYIRELVAAAHGTALDVEPTDHDTHAAVDERAVPGYLQRQLGFYVFVFVLGSLFAGLGYAAAAHDRRKLQAAAVELCAFEPRCPHDEPRLTYVDPIGVRGGERLVLSRRSSDCARVLESYHDPSGRRIFAGSLDDPDPDRREQFRERRDAFMRGHATVTSVACEQAGELCGWWAFGCR